MGKITGFLEIEREDRDYAPVAERTRHFREFVLPPSSEDVKQQAARCMDCGIPYCHRGCPSTTRSPIGTISSITESGRTRRAICIRPIISRK